MQGVWESGVAGRRAGLSIESIVMRSAARRVTCICMVERAHTVDGRVVIFAHNSRVFAESIHFDSVPSLALLRL